MEHIIPWQLMGLILAGVLLFTLSVVMDSKKSDPEILQVFQTHEEEEEFPMNWDKNHETLFLITLIFSLVIVFILSSVISVLEYLTKKRKVGFLVISIIIVLFLTLWASTKLDTYSPLWR